jgi:hypothetical protein
MGRKSRDELPRAPTGPSRQLEGREDEQDLLKVLGQSLRSKKRESNTHDLEKLDGLDDIGSLFDVQPERVRVFKDSTRETGERRSRHGKREGSRVGGKGEREM